MPTKFIIEDLVAIDDAAAPARRTPNRDAIERVL
jgi:hypothetical protein